MSYAKNLEAKIRQEGYDDLPRRIQAVEDQLNRPASLNHIRVRCELLYLERAVSGKRVKPGLAEQVRELRRRFDAVQVGSENAWASTNTSAQPSLVRNNSLEERSRTDVGAVASFLCPDDSPEDGEDKVRLLSMNGRLANEMSRYPILAVKDNSSAVVMRSWKPEELRTWTSEDDEAAEEAQKSRERYLLLSVDQMAANLKEMQELVAETILQQGTELDAVEENVSDARENVERGVGFLKEANEADAKNNMMLKWIAPSVGLVVLGAGAVLCPAGAAAGVAVKAGLLFGGTGFTLAGAGVFTLWQKQALAAMEEQLPRAFERLPDAEVKALCNQGDLAESHLLKKLGGQWTLFPWSWKALRVGLKARYQDSEARVGGSAWYTTFDTDLSARQVFEVVQQLSVAGELEHGCKLVWSRPVDDATYVRYLAFQEVHVDRDFFCICRQGKVTSGDDSKEEHYVYVLSSLDQAILDNAGSALPHPDRSSRQHAGTIQICGISIKDRAASKGGGAVVEVMADVDQATISPAIIADRDVRLHVLATAQRVMSELKSEEHESK